MSERCNQCGGSHQTAVAEARCAYERIVRDSLVIQSQDLDKPPTAAQVIDLWAHARQHGDDGAEAARWVRVVLDLGWRPAIGASS
jgi:hypothetical protein